ncbi:MAG: glucokinase [Deltaproteobacteria bacterium]|nr:glucokinase [Deltaproteobacteria bacterium]
MLLAGDVGGTKTILGVFTPESGPLHALTEATFENARYPDLETIVRQFLGSVKMPVERACFGIAGPVVAGRPTAITNLPWVIDGERLRSELDIAAVSLVNDLAATARAIPSLPPGDLRVLSKGEAAPGGNIGVVAPGTGLGEAFLVWSDQRYREYASEGGHADFAPNNILEIELLRFLLEKYEHVSYDNVCSGQGLPDIYRFLRDRNNEEEPPWLAEELAAAPDVVPVIVNAALDSGRYCGLCVKTLSLFLAILGAEAGNLALRVLATGGIYVAGGIVPRILPFLEKSGFMEAFRRKGRFSDFVGRAPVSVVLNPRAALLGAAGIGLESYRGHHDFP